MKSLAIPDSIRQSAIIPVLQVLCGSLFLALMARIAMPLPFSPVPVSMQTLGVALLAITLGPKKALFSVLAYMSQASMGLPVLAGGTVNPLWMIGPRAGYIVGFAASAFTTGTLLSTIRTSSFIKTWLVLALSEIIILALGAGWLSFYVGLENSFMMGVLPFLIGACAKSTIASAAFMPIRWIQSRI